MTNAGNALRELPEAAVHGQVTLPGAVVEDLEFILPHRSRQALAFSTHKYAIRLKITLACDSRIHSRDEATETPPLFVKEMNSFSTPSA